jgi:hypothetical protein
MAWVKTKWVDSLFAAFNRRFPNRDRSTDGTIGNPDHAEGVSGHNPDDTPGVRAEREDPDTKQEVRAADVDDDLRDPAGLTMQSVIDAILRTPADRDRLIYIIYNRFIWRRSNGWKRESYGGDNPHTSHAHFSGDPAADENGAPWNSILTLGGSSMAGEADAAFSREYTGNESWVSGKSWMAKAVEFPLRDIVARLTRLEARIGTPAPVDVAALATALAPLLNVDESALVEALQSDAGQAAIIGAVNKAEDS